MATKKGTVQTNNVPTVEVTFDDENRKFIVTTGPGFYEKYQDGKSMNGYHRGPGTFEVPVTAGTHRFACYVQGRLLPNPEAVHTFN